MRRASWCGWSSCSAARCTRETRTFLKTCAACGRASALIKVSGEAHGACMVAASGGWHVGPGFLMENPQHHASMQLGQ